MSATAPSPNDLTRQQLDELDALLQRMLSVPLNAPISDPAPTPVPVVQPAPSVSLPVGWRVDAAATAAPRPTFSAETAEEIGQRVEAMAVTVAATTEVGNGMVRTLAGAGFNPQSAGPLRGVDAPALPTGFRPTPEQTPSPVPVATVPATEPAPVELTQAVATVPPANRNRVPVPLWPIFAVNWVIELFLGLLGPVGTVLTHPAMKHLLGIAGVVLLAGAAAWSARGMGWVTW